MTAGKDGSEGGMGRSALLRLKFQIWGESVSHLDFLLIGCSLFTSLPFGVCQTFFQHAQAAATHSCSPEGALEVLINVCVHLDYIHLNISIALFIHSVTRTCVQ